MLSFGEPTRSRRSNLPVGIRDYTPNGVRLGDRDAVRRDALYGVLAAALSRSGCETELGVMAAEGALSESPRTARPDWSADSHRPAFPGPVPGWGWGRRRQLLRPGGRRGGLRRRREWSASGIGGAGSGDALGPGGSVAGRAQFASQVMKRLTLVDRSSTKVLPPRWSSPLASQVQVIDASMV